VAVHAGSQIGELVETRWCLLGPSPFDVGGTGWQRIVAAGQPFACGLSPRLAEVLSRLAQEDPQTAELEKLRDFSGLRNKQLAEVLGMSPCNADFRWAFARAWLFEKIEGGSSHRPPEDPDPRLFS
jgi:hypothetical protein